jgi:hypothetical protein
MPMNNKPTTFPIVKASPRSITPKTKTKAGDRLIKGYARVNSNFVIASIQNTEAMKADRNPEKMNGSNKNFRYDKQVVQKVALSMFKPTRLIRHLMINCP